jgi:hypothetical protein
MKLILLGTRAFPTLVKVFDTRDVFPIFYYGLWGELVLLVHKRSYNDGLSALLRAFRTFRALKYSNR